MGAAQVEPLRQQSGPTGVKIISKLSCVRRVHPTHSIHVSSEGGCQHVWLWQTFGSAWAKGHYLHYNTSQSVSPLWHQSLTLNKTLKIIHYSVSASSSLPLCQLLDSRRLWEEVVCCGSPAFFALLRRRRRVTERISKGRKGRQAGWLAAEQPEEA